MANEEELNALANELQLQQTRGEAIRQQMGQMQQTVIEIGAAMEAINNLKKAKGETLVPIGAGVFVSCPKPDSERVIINIGANLMVNKKPDDAVKMLEDRQKKVRDAMKEAQAELQQIVRTVEELTGRANALSQAEEKNVRASKE